MDAVTTDMVTPGLAISDPVDDLDGEGFEFVERGHADRVLEGLNGLRLKRTLCDVTLCCGGQDFPCHRAVMASCSSYFHAMFSLGLVESRQERVAIGGVEPHTVGLLVSYAYTARVRLNATNVQALLVATNLLGVLPVREACCSFMERQLDDVNCVGVHCFAEAHGCTRLKERSLQYILSHFPRVHTQDEFLSLPADKLVEIIASDHLNVTREETVFNAILLWVLRDESRSHDFHKILEHVRLPLMNPYYLHDVVEAQTFIRDSLPCQRLVAEAKDYLLLQDRRGELFGPRAHPRKSEGVSELIVVAGGEDDKVILRSVESFDPIKRHWNCLACLPCAISKHGLVASGSVLYLAGGEFSDGVASNDLWRYDPIDNMWYERAAMNVARSELGLAMLDGLVFAVGGWEGSSRLASIECYNPSVNAWRFLASMKMAVTSPAVVAFGGLLYVAGGAVLEDGDGMNLVQVYNPKCDSWSEVAPMQIPRSGSVACILHGKIYVIGGWHASTENTNKVEQYDPRTNTWTMCAPMNERRYRPGVAVVDGTIYVMGGEEGWDRYHDTIEEYREEYGKWEILGEMLTSRSWLSCVTVQVQKETWPGHSAENVSAD
ncbi:kelch-like protein 24 isoform X2 [Rhinoraja longicauda]